MGEQFFCNVMEYCGVNFFKCYWPPYASYWNETHMDPNCLSDLLSTIRLFKSNISFYVGQILAMIFVLVPTALISYWLDLINLNFVYFIGIFMLVLGTKFMYGIMLNKYNLILANKCIRKISRNSPSFCSCRSCQKN